MDHGCRSRVNLLDPGCTQDLSTRSIRNEGNEMSTPGSIFTFFTSRPTCKEHRDRLRGTRSNWHGYGFRGRYRIRWLSGGSRGVVKLRTVCGGKGGTGGRLYNLSRLQSPSTRSTAKLFCGFDKSGLVLGRGWRKRYRRCTRERVRKDACC
ncbi:hypothetical protein BC826DRAFT_465318 [Russula brevipes]|nr:hypothetical protein BC826DRAFT_465318 [Russula brevipes]